MKKLFTLFLGLALVVSTGIVGCGGGVDNTTKTVDPKGNRPKETTEKENESTDKKDGTKFAGGEGTANLPPD